MRIPAIFLCLLGSCAGPRPAPAPEPVSEPAPASEPPAPSEPPPVAGAPDRCTSDADCVPATCCHPDRCVPRGQQERCEAVMCTRECRPQTLDCGGSCACVEGRCAATLWSGADQPAPQ